MKNTSGIGLFVAAAGAVASLPASAAPVTLSHSVALSTLLEQGNSVDLSFDIGGFLSSQGFGTADVQGGSVSVFGFSEASYGPAQAAPYGDYNVQTSASGTHLGYYSYYVSGYRSCNSWGWSCYYSPGYTAYATYTIQDYAQYSDRDMLHQDTVADQMMVTVGDSSATDTASTQSSSAGSFGAYLYDGSYNTNCWNNNCTYNRVYHRERDVYSAVYGDLSASLSLDAAALLDLQGDGQLSVGLAAPVGHFKVNSVSFDLVVQQALASQPLTAPSGSDVPEPASLALTALALAAATAAGRRRKIVGG